MKDLFLSYEGCSVSRSYTAVLWLAVPGSVSIWDFLSGYPSSKGKVSLESLLDPLPSATEIKICLIQSSPSLFLSQQAVM